MALFGKCGNTTKMFSIPLIALAAILNACMDKYQFHYHRSVFMKYHLVKFFMSDGWLNKYVDRDPAKGRVKIWGVNMHPAFLDVWHFCKSGMVILICAAVVLHQPIMGLVYDLILYGLVWNLTFSLFWGFILESND